MLRCARRKVLAALVTN